MRYESTDSSNRTRGRDNRSFSFLWCDLSSRASMGSSGATPAHGDYRRNPVRYCHRQSDARESNTQAAYDVDQAGLDAGGLMYGKIFSDIFDGSLMAQGGWMATYVFIGMIVIADKDGIVRLDAVRLYERLGLEHDDFIFYQSFLGALEVLEANDTQSNLATEKGRRIIPLKEMEGEEQRGWWIVNYEFYRAKASKIDKTETSNERVKRFRDRDKSVTLGNADVTLSNASAGHTDTDVDLDFKDLNTYVGQTPDAPALKAEKKASLQNEAREILTFLNTKTGRRYQPVSANLDMIVSRMKEGATVVQLRQVVVRKTRDWQGDEKMAPYLRPATLFSRKLFWQYAGELVPEGG